MPFPLISATHNWFSHSSNYDISASHPLSWNGVIHILSIVPHFVQLQHTTPSSRCALCPSCPNVEYGITTSRISSFPPFVSARPHSKTSVYSHQLANPFQDVSCTYLTGIRARKLSSLSIHMPVCTRTHSSSSSKQTFAIFDLITMQRGVLEQFS